MEETEGPFYTRSNGQRLALKAMATAHLKSAYAKLLRDWPGHSELDPMAHEIAVRDAEFAARQAAASPL